jgi:transcriptional regulator with XRE-family HTH domain
MSFKTVEPCSVRIKKALSIRNMTQTELCSKTKISKSTLSEYLTGRYEPKQDRIYILSQALNVDPVWLWGYDVPMEKKETPEEKKIPLTEDQLSEGEKLLLELFRQIPEDRQPEALDLLRVALKMQQKP